jgi:hypothetical protein
MGRSRVNTLTAKGVWPPGASGAAAARYAFAILDSPLTLVGVAAPGRRDPVTIVSNPDEWRRIDGAKRCCLGRVVRMLCELWQKPEPLM